MRCKINNLKDFIEKELKEYSQEVAEDVKDCVRESAIECRNELRLTSPKRTGEYAESWIDEVVENDRFFINAVIRNEKHYQLTHLLEKGHAGVDGTSVGSAPAIPHIAPAEKRINKSAIEKVKSRLRK